MSPVECLRAAREVLRDRGWTRLAFIDARGGVCLRAAVMIASDWDDDAALGACLLLFEAGCRGAYMTDSGPRTGIEGWSDSLDDSNGRAHVDAAITRAIHIGQARPSKQRGR